jgi:hypothetical protein
MQNIANVQQMAGIPALGAPFMSAPPAAAPAASREGLVYNPIPNDRTELVYNPVAYKNVSIPARETGYGFKPVEVTGMPTDLADLYDADGSGSVFSRLARQAVGLKAGQPGPRVQYEFDKASQTLRPTQAYLDAIEARRQEKAAAEEAMRQAAAMASYYAEGGSVPTLEEGGFVLTKKAVDGLGKGDNKKGQKTAQAGLGAIPIKGKGTGTSDSIPTTIAGKQPARVSNGEAYVPARKVKENGGAKAFYALMRRAEKAA